MIKSFNLIVELNFAIEKTDGKDDFTCEQYLQAQIDDVNSKKDDLSLLTKSFAILVSEVENNRSKARKAAWVRKIKDSHGDLKLEIISFFSPYLFTENLVFDTEKQLVVQESITVNIDPEIPLSFFNYIKRNEFNTFSEEKKASFYKDKMNAIDLLENEEFFKSVIILDPLIRTNPSDKELLIAIGHSYSGMKQPQKALFYVEKALSIDPHNIHARFLKGCLLGDLNFHPDGVDIIKKVIKDGLANEETYGNLGIIYQNSSDYLSAIEAYKKALEFQSPHLPKIENRMAQCYSGLGNFSEAMQIYNALINNNPNDVAAIFNKAIDCDRMGNSVESIELLKKVVETDPDFLPAWKELANISKANGLEEESNIANNKIKELKNYNNYNS